MLRVVALDVAAGLDGYLLELAELCRKPGEIELRRALRARLGQLGGLALMLPVLWAPWGSVVVLHFKATHPKWIGEPDLSAQRQLLAETDAAVAVLRRTCVRWAAQPHQDSPGSLDAVATAFSAWDAVRHELHLAEQQAGRTSALVRPPGAAGLDADDLSELRRLADGMLERAVGLLRG